MKLKVEIADSPQSLSYGLMHRKELPQDQGMLFKFPGALEASFWGKNTYIPLDVAFIDNTNRITEIKNIAPMSTRLVRSSGLCQMAVEANAGFFDKHGIQCGSKIQVVHDNSGKAAEIEFIND